MRFRLAVLALICAVGASLGFVGAAAAQENGYATKRPIMGAACPNCVWGPFAVVTKNIMAKRGWDIQICWNCNRQDSPRFVAKAMETRELTPQDAANGYLPSPKGKVDFGVTNERALLWMYHGEYDYKADGPHRNLRLIALFEDPAYFAVAVDKKTGITDLKQIREKRMPVRIFPGNMDDVLLEPVFEYYGIMPKDLESWGGKYVTRSDAMTNGVDVILNRSASNANNFESMIWNWASNTKDIRFLTLPKDLRDRLVAERGYSHVVMPIGYFRGVEADIPTVERSGQAVYGRDDMPDEFAYQLAKAMDEDRLEYLWSIRPFIYEPRKVAKLGDVPLHPGAERYYREVGYIK